jgi:hypothetical protein
MKFSCRIGLMCAAISLLSFGCLGSDKPVTFTLTASQIAATHIADIPSAIAGSACFVKDGSIKIDGDLSDWPQNLRPMKTRGISPAEDISASAFVAVSPAAIYLAFEVTDDVHYQREYGDRMWMGDSVQFAIDPLLERTQGRYGDYNHEIGLCFVEGAPLVWRWQRPIGMKSEVVPGAKLAVSIGKSRTIYEVAIPLQELWPLRPELSALCGFSYLVNDSDGSCERESYAAWSSGIGSGKDASAFGVLEFPECTELISVGLAGRFLLPQDPTPSNKPQEWTLELFARCAGVVKIQCEGTVEYGKYRGSPVRAVATLNAPKGLSKWKLLADLAKLSPARIRLQPSISLGGIRDAVPPHEFTIYVYTPREQ